MTLLQRLTEMQRDAGLSDRKFAKLLRVHNTLWTYTRRGKTPVRFQILRGAVQAFPEDEQLHKQVIDFLSAAERSEPLAKPSQEGTSL